jgi:enoyl reductase-like protein
MISYAVSGIFGKHSVHLQQARQAFLFSAICQRSHPENPMLFHPRLDQTMDIYFVMLS